MANRHLTDSIVLTHLRSTGWDESSIMDRSGETGREETDHMKPEEHAAQPSLTMKGTATLLPKHSFKQSSKIPPKTPQDPPRSPQPPPKIHPRSPQDHPKTPQHSQEAPQIPPRSLMITPKNLARKGLLRHHPKIRPTLLGSCKNQPKFGTAPPPLNPSPMIPGSAPAFVMIGRL